MSDDEERIDFTATTKKIIGARVSYQCSVPRCRNPAHAPNDYDDNASVNMGTACHIYAAKKKGPRGQGDKTEDFIASAENGLWCCNYHGSRIDKNKGREFSVETLFMWKRLAEARVNKISSGYVYPYGWVKSIEITSTEKLPIFEKRLPKLKLSKNTIVHSEQMCGQSTFLEFIGCVKKDNYLYRWKEIDQSPTIKAKVLYDTLDYEIEYSIALINGRFNRKKNDRTERLPPHDIEIFYVNLEEDNKNEDIVDHFLKFLDIDLVTFDLILENISEKNAIFPGKFKRIIEMVDDEFDEDTVIEKRKYDESLCFTIETSCQKNSEIYKIEYGGFSRSEKIRFLLSLIISKIEIISEQKPVLLILGSRSLNLDAPILKKLLQILRKMEIQTILEAPWRYQKIFEWQRDKTELNILEWKGYDSQDDLLSLYEELQFWDIKDIFQDNLEC